MSPAPVSVDHLAFPTRDLEKTDHFYAKVIGATLVHAESGYSPSWKSDYLLMTYSLPDGTRLSFFDWPADTGPYPNDPHMPDEVFHIGLRCDAPRDVIAWQNHLFQHKVVYHNEDDGRARRLFFRDPNGIRFEIFASETSKSGRDHEGEARAVVREWQKITGG
ncbi:VOC family protein [Thalassospira lucentensis]|uniref:VOC family protein n=1 Tax=Thalassospira lucentensis TaxID=168935 RepID=UPI003D2EF47F